MRFFAYFALLLPLAAEAHPVAFRGSVGFMGYHSRDMSDSELNYSVRHWFAPSLQLLRVTEGTGRPDIGLLKANFLVKRWNWPEAQGNVYLNAGGGLSRLGGKERGVGELGFTFDIEDRRLYFLSSGNWFRSGRGTELSYWKVRGGFAPYVGSFDQLHSWLILELNRKSVGDTSLNVVPTLRFFYQNVLWELGSSLKGDTHFNFIIHI